MVWEKKCAAYLKALNFTVPEAGDLVQEAGFNSNDYPELDEILATARTAEVLPEAVTEHLSCRGKPELIHPLNGSNLNFPSNVNWEQAGQDLKTAVLRLRERRSDSIKGFFLDLWRILPDDLAANDTCGLKEYWKLVPGHFAMPFHTIWQWASVCSSFAAAWPNPHILLFTLSSTQEFVSSARRTQDAWAGSFIFSDLSWSGVRYLAEKFGPDVLVSPSLKEQAIVDHWLSSQVEGVDPDSSNLQVAAIPNMLTAIVPGDNIQNLTKDILDRIKDKWLHMSKEVHAKLQNTINVKTRGQLNHIPSYQEDIAWERQTTDFVPSLGFFWSAAGISDAASVLDILEAEAGRGIEDSSRDNLFALIRKLSADQSSNRGLSYSLMSKEAGTALTARKNLRNFKQGKEPNYKCSLCGTREVWTGSIQDKPVLFTDMREFWTIVNNLDSKKGKDKQYFKLAGRFRKGERLCPVCITKRLALEGPYADEFSFDHLLFPSTSGIASMYFRKMLLKYIEQDHELKGLVKDYAEKIIDYLDKNHIFFAAAQSSVGEFKGREHEVHKRFRYLDGQWFYPESLENEDAVRRETGLEKEAKLDGDLNDVRKDLTDLKKHIRKHYPDSAELFMPSPYYAVIAMDGDKIGDWVVGKKSPSVTDFSHSELREKIKDLYPLQDNIGQATSSPMGPLFQLALSECLKNYIKHKARQIVEEKHCGKLIYAGGDDLVAFVPLPTLLECMHDIYAEFGFGEDGNSNGWNQSHAYSLPGGRKAPNNAQASGMTISMGVVIAHHSRPLWDVMAQAQSVLKEKAKKGLGRNAFAFRIVKRSGEVAETGCKFDVDHGGVKTILPVLQQIQDAFSKKISSSIGTTLAAQKWAFDFPVGNSKNFPDPTEITNLQKSELKRLCRQHLFNKKEDEVVKEIGDLFNLLKEVKNLDHKDTRCVSTTSTLRTTQKEVKKPDNNESLMIDPWGTLVSLLLTLKFLTGKED